MVTGVNVFLKKESEIKDGTKCCSDCLTRNSNPRLTKN